MPLSILPRADQSSIAISQSRNFVFSVGKMDVEAKRFGSGPRELGGAADLINRCKLWPQYESFCKRSIPLSISDTRYLDNVVGDTEIRKGEGMELDQLFRNASSLRGRNTSIHCFDMGILGDAFRLKETTSVKLPFAEKGIPTGMAKLKQKEKKRKKFESKDKQLEKNDSTKRKHRHKNRRSKEDKDKNLNSYGSGFEQFKGRLKGNLRFNTF